MSDTTTQAPERPLLEEMARVPHLKAFSRHDLPAVASYALWLEEENRRLRSALDAQEQAVEYVGQAGRLDGPCLSLEGWKAMDGTLEPASPVRIFSGEHRLWWMPNGRGYTAVLRQAWICDFAEALTHTQHCGPEKRIVYYPVDSNA